MRHTDIIFEGVAGAFGWMAKSSSLTSSRSGTLIMEPRTARGINKNHLREVKGPAYIGKRFVPAGRVATLHATKGWRERRA